MTQETSEPLVRFLKELDGVLGADLIGAILFGSWAGGQPTESSDLDLAVVVSDSNADRARFEAFRVLERSGLDRDVLSMSVESYLRLKEFIELGDPFAWVVCTRGRILHDRSGLLEDLQSRCKCRVSEPAASGVVQYLQNKAQTHRTQAMQFFRQFLSSTQLSVMAAAQAAALQESREPVVGQTLVEVAEWQTLENMLPQSFSGEDAQAAAELILAQKELRQDPSHVVAELPNKLARVTSALIALLEQRRSGLPDE